MVKIDLLLLGIKWCRFYKMVLFCLHTEALIYLPHMQYFICLSPTPSSKNLLPILIIVNIIIIIIIIMIMTLSSLWWSRQPRVEERLQPQMETRNKSCHLPIIARYHFHNCHPSSSSYIFKLCQRQVICQNCWNQVMTDLQKVSMFEVNFANRFSLCVKRFDIWQAIELSIEFT